MQMLAVSGASVINPYRFTESEVAEAAELAERCLAGIDDLAFSRTVTEHSRDERLKRRLRWCLDFPAEDSESAALKAIEQTRLALAEARAYYAKRDRESEYREREYRAFRLQKNNALKKEMRRNPVLRDIVKFGGFATAPGRGHDGPDGVARRATAEGVAFYEEAVKRRERP